MKLNISYPAKGSQKKIEVEDEAKLRAFYDKRLGQEIDGEALGEEFKGYILKITGGQDKQGFPMKQGVLSNGRVRLLMAPGDKCFKGYGRRNGERRRKSVRGCILAPDLALINLAIVKKGEKEFEGLTDEEKPRRLGPKRASKIRKLFNLSKEDDVRKYVTAYARKVERNGKVRYKCPKIQRLVTPKMLERKRRIQALKNKRWARVRAEQEDHHQLLVRRLKEARERRSESLAKRKEKLRTSQASRE